MHVGVKPKLLVPSMQHNRGAKSRSESASCKHTQCGCGAGKEQPKNDSGSKGGERTQLGGHRKDNVKMCDIEQPASLVFNPLLLHQRLTLRTMPIAARVICRVLETAGLTDIKMAAERGRAASRNIGQHSALLSAEPDRLLESRTMLSDDIGQFEV